MTEIKEFNVQNPLTFLGMETFLENKKGEKFLKKLDALDIVVLGLIRWYCGLSEQYQCNASNDTLCKKLVIHVQTLQASLLKLENAGLIERHPIYKIGERFCRVLVPTSKVKKFKKYNKNNYNPYSQKPDNHVYVKRT